MTKENLKILVVDDDVNLLNSFKRNLGRKYHVEIAEGAEQAISLLRSTATPFGLVISDYNMPNIKGVELLGKIRDEAPDTVRVLLTGFADLEVAINAVNEGGIFRLLTKPCPPEVLVRTIKDAARQYELVTAERELLEKTLKGSVQVMSEVLTLLKPDVWGRATRVMPYVRQLSERLADPNPWETETATLLSQLGYILLSETVIRKMDRGRALSAEEYEEYSRHSGVAADLIMNIPRLENVAEAVRFQEKNYDGTGPPDDDVSREKIPLAARILKVVLDYDRMVEGGTAPADAPEALKRRAGYYDPKIIEALVTILDEVGDYRPKNVRVAGLKPGMILDETLFMNRNGKMLKLLGKGQELSQTTVDYIKKLSYHVKISEPIRVLEQYKRN